LAAEENQVQRGLDRFRGSAGAEHTLGRGHLPWRQAVGSGHLAVPGTRRYRLARHAELFSVSTEAHIRQYMNADASAHCPTTAADQRAGVNSTRMRLMPWMNADWSMSGAPFTWMSGRRCSSSSNITLISRRARFAPRQKWGPPAPKPTWSFGVRVTSKREGSGQNASSRFAEVYQRTTLSPARIACPPSSRSPVAVRRKWIT